MGIIFVYQLNFDKELLKKRTLNRQLGLFSEMKNDSFFKKNKKNEGFKTRTNFLKNWFLVYDRIFRTKFKEVSRF